MVLYFLKIFRFCNSVFDGYPSPRSITFTNPTKRTVRIPTYLGRPSVVPFLQWDRRCFRGHSYVCMILVCVPLTMRSLRHSDSNLEFINNRTNCDVNCDLKTVTFLAYAITRRIAAKRLNAFARFHMRVV